MNTLPRLLRTLAPIFGAALLAAPVTVHAADGAQTHNTPIFLASPNDSDPSGWYLTGDAGLTSLPNFTRTANSGTTFNYAFNSGYEFGLTLGKAVFSASDFGATQSDDWNVAAEFEAAYMDNSLKSVAGKGPASGSLQQIPLLVNLVGTYNVSDNWSAYIGFGGGLARSDLKVSTAGGAAVNFTNTESDGVIQAKIGVRYKLSDNTSLGLGYKYLDILHTSYHTDIDSHTFFVDFTWRF